MKRIALSIAGAAAIALTGFGGLAIAPSIVKAEAVAKATELVAGSFVTVEQDHPTTGSAHIIEENGQRYLELSEGFSTATGPAVYVTLHKDSSVGVNLDEGDYVTLAPLQSFSGAQRYAISDDIDVSDFNSVVIWCEEFNVTFGYASL
jgi:hypothetical protein